MNIKSLRKDYDKLSKRERFILFDSAENRDDEAEMDAILLATPNERWMKPDFAVMAEQMLKLRLVFLIQRLKHCREAMFWLSISEIEDSRQKGKKKDHFFYDYARLNAYFYCISVDSSRAIVEELGLDFEAWEKKKNEVFDLGPLDKITDSLMRTLAFDETEAEDCVNKIGNEYGVKNIVLGFTLEREVKVTLETLKETGFAEFFKN